MKRWSSLAWVLVSAALIRLSFPPFDGGPFMLVAWVPYLWALRGAGARRALLLGFCHGSVLGLAAHAWVVPAITLHSDVPTWQAAGALLAIAASCGLRSALVGWAIAFTMRKGVRLTLAFPLLLAAAELLVPGFFPWTNALAVHAIPPWSQLAALGGAPLVSAWLSLVNALVAQAVMSWVETGPRTAVASLGAALGVVLGVSAFGFFSISTQSTRAQAAPRLRVALGHAASRGSDQADLVPDLRALTIAHQQRQGDSELVLWPEGVSPLPLRVGDAASTARSYWLRDRQQSPTAPQVRGRLLLGVSLDTPGGLRNSALLMDRGGRLLGEYAKRTLVPLGETALLPIAFSGGTLGQGVTSYQPGSASPALSIDGHPLATSICFEDILADATRTEVVRTGAELLVNLTSDRWFKGTSAVEFHFALAKLRAVEHRKFLLRSTLDGVSAVVDSAGYVLLHADPAQSRILDADVPFLSGLTPYARFASAQRWVWFMLATFVLLHARYRGAPASDTRAG